MLQQVCHVVDGGVHITCPFCNKNMNGKVKKRKNTCVVVRCLACEDAFSVQLDYRQQYRKSTQFSGNGSCERMGYFPVTIDNVSKTGIKFQVCKSKCDLHIDETVSLRFQLDDKNNTDIQVSVKICHSDGTMYGGAFIEKYLSPKISKAIGFWLQ